MSPGGAVTAAVVLTAAAGLAAAAEVAIATVSRVHAEDLVRNRRRHAERLLRISTDPPRYLNTATLIRVGSEITATVFVVVALHGALPGAWGFVLAAVVMSLVSFVVVGVAPRTLARRHPERIALALAGPLTAVTTLLGPIPTWLIALGSLVVGGRGVREGPFATEARLREMIDLAEEHSAIEADERVMIHRVFDLGDTLVREVMVPRPDIVAIEAGRNIGQAERLMLRSGFSRLPVTGPGGTDDVTGFVYLKDLARRMLEDRDAAGAVVESALRPPVWVPDSKAAADLLRDMQRERVHIAVVADEYGGTAGLVTIEDILEEIVGEITDEYDVAVAEPEQLPDGRAARHLPDATGTTSGICSGWSSRTTTSTPSAGCSRRGWDRCRSPSPHTEIAGLYLEAESRGERRNRVNFVVVRRLATDSGHHADPAADQGVGEGHGVGDGQGVGERHGLVMARGSASATGSVTATGPSGARKRRTGRYRPTTLIIRGRWSPVGPDRPAPGDPRSGGRRAHPVGERSSSSARSGSGPAVRPVLSGSGGRCRPVSWPGPPGRRLRVASFGAAGSPASGSGTSSM